jgi:hypothetical protein
MLRGKHLNSGLRGGLWDGEHLRRMGPAVWLFGWLVHRQTRERDGVGLVLAGSALTYEMISQDTGMAVRTLKRWMARLVRAGYIHVRHTTHKRMVIQIAKAKKFGPQQLRFPQTQPNFPQFHNPSFIAPKSKGPLPVRDAPSKGPILAQTIAAAPAQLFAKTPTYTRAESPNRQYEPERQTTETAPLQANRCKGLNRSSVSMMSSRRADAPTMRHYPIRYGPDRRVLRELEVRAELRVGAGPEIHRQ